MLSKSIEKLKKFFFSKRKKKSSCQSGTVVLVVGRLHAHEWGSVVLGCIVWPIQGRPAQSYCGIFSSFFIFYFYLFYFFISKASFFIWGMIVWKWRKLTCKRPLYNVVVMQVQYNYALKICQAQLILSLDFNPPTKLSTLVKTKEEGSISKMKTHEVKRIIGY